MGKGFGKIMPADAITLKTAVMHYLRFERQLPYVATEVGSFSADVAGSNGELLIEVEVKVSITDMLCDLRKHKHKCYAGNPGPDPRNYPGVGNKWESWIPHQFFFMVPVELQKEAEEVLAAKFSPAYGLMIYEPISRLPFKCVRIVKRTKPIHSNPVNDVAKRDFILRMASDLCYLYNRRIAVPMLSQSDVLIKREW
jgi:hypothetical protein